MPRAGPYPCMKSPPSLMTVSEGAVHFFCLKVQGIFMKPTCLSQSAGPALMRCRKLMVTNPRWSSLLLFSAIFLLVCRSASVSKKDTPSRFDEASLLNEVFGDDEQDESKGPTSNTRRQEPTLQNAQTLDSETDHGQVVSEKPVIFRFAP